MRWPRPHIRYHRHHVMDGRHCWCEPRIEEDAEVPGRFMVVHDEPGWRGSWATTWSLTNDDGDIVVVPFR